MGETGRIVRIGGGSGFLGDSSIAPPQLIEAGIDYLMLDYLAEATMSALGALKAQRPEHGYASDFTDWVWKDNLDALKRTGTRIVTNAGGVNPHACAARMRAIAAEQGLDFRIAVIDGDDLMGRLDELADSGRTKELYTGLPFPPRDKIVSANAYLGARPIAKALAMGADVVITGRCVDSALALGPLIHEFGWSETDLDQLAQGSLAGHVIECGAQGSGALFTDWEDVPDWANIGYPIIECAADGSFVVTKPEGTGGLVSEGVVIEQILYEIGNPQDYALPDVVCDFTQVKVEQVGEQRVRVSGARGYPPSGRYKVSMTWADGWRCIAVMPIVGRDAARKGEKQADAMLSRLDSMLRQRNIGPYRATRVELIGAESSYGANSRARDTREIVLKIAAEHDDREAFGVFLREFDSPMTSMSVGSTGWFAGRPEVRPVMRVFSTMIDRAAVPVTIHMDGTTADATVGAPPRRFDPADVTPPPPGDTVTPGADWVDVPLIQLAWARSGDKGDAFNIGVAARRPDYLPYIRTALAPEAMRDFFAHEFEGAANPAVRLYELPGMHALNLHFLDALGGGQFASLRLDPLAKGKAQQLLDFPVKVRRTLA